MIIETFRIEAWIQIVQKMLQPERTSVKIIIIKFHRYLQILSPVVKTFEKGTERLSQEL
jgi:hypothetical protein